MGCEVSLKSENSVGCGVSLYSEISVGCEALWTVLSMWAVRCLYTTGAVSSPRVVMPLWTVRSMWAVIYLNSVDPEISVGCEVSRDFDIL